MWQKLSAMKYIKNNKQRVAVLIVSLALCFVLVYLTQFLLVCNVMVLVPLIITRSRQMLKADICDY